MVSDFLDRFPGLDIPLRDAIDEIEASRFERTSGTSIFAIPVRIASAITIFWTTSSWAFFVTLLLGLLLVMWLIDALPSLFSLRWSQSPVLCELPDGVRREMIRGPEGMLELLVSEAEESESTSGKPAVLFVHGVFGSAGVWLPWMRFLHSSKADYAGNLYALSLRGHGGSFSPGFVEMTYLTSMTTLSTDVAAALKWIGEREGALGNRSGLIIAAHSGGGGLVQHALASEKFPVKTLTRVGGVRGITLIGSVPPFGSAGVYLNWIISDPFTLVRGWLQFGHPRSPLASTKLVHKAFFSKEYPEHQVKEFEKAMPHYESLIWPSQMMFGRFVDVEDVLAEMTAKHVLVIAADEDRLVGVQGQRQMAREYASALHVENMEKEFTNMHDVRIEAKGTVLQGEKHGRASGSLQLNLIRRSGHHLQNDVHRDKAAEVFRKWADSV